MPYQKDCVFASHLISHNSSKNQENYKRLNKEKTLWSFSHLKYQQQIIQSLLLPVLKCLHQFHWLWLGLFCLLPDTPKGQQTTIQFGMKRQFMWHQWLALQWPLVLPSSAVLSSAFISCGAVWPCGDSTQSYRTSTLSSTLDFCWVGSWTCLLTSKSTVRAV